MISAGGLKWTGSLSIVAIVLMSFALTVSRSRRPSLPSSHQIPVARPPHRATLYCEFYDFMRKSVVVGFDFDVVDPKHPGFAERFVVEYETTKTDFGVTGKPSPIWTYAIDDGIPMISSENGETRVVLYGIKPSMPGILWFEAGVRSNQYRNLEGKCRQSYLSP